MHTAQEAYVYRLKKRPLGGPGRSSKLRDPAFPKRPPRPSKSERSRQEKLLESGCNDELSYVSENYLLPGSCLPVIARAVISSSTCPSFHGKALGSLDIAGQARILYSSC